MDVKVLFQYQISRFPKPLTEKSAMMIKFRRRRRKQKCSYFDVKIESQNEDSWWVTGQENKYAMKYYFLF